MSKTKKINRYFMLKPITDIVTHFQQYESNFDVRLTNYSITLETNAEKYFFADEPISVQAFAMHALINKDIGGEIRQVPSRIKYFDFSGMKQAEPIEKCYCVDINSAYLKALQLEGIITPETFADIDKKSRASKHAKMNRLKAVGLFARQPTIISYRSGEVEEITTKENPFSWVFFQACKTTGKSMEAIKKSQSADFLFYWVDGIFLRSNPEPAVNYLNSIGFECKIEEINNLRIIENAVIYEKEGKSKLLFMPQTEKTNNYEFISRLNRAKTL
jgi:hypothetical protein